MEGLKMNKLILTLNKIHSYYADCTPLYTVQILSITDSKLEAPKIIDVTALEPAGIHIKWHVMPYFATDPITGYLVRIWRVEESTQGHFTLINGDETPGLMSIVRVLEI
ncbi:unnamed protein product [Leptidea sinapis]|uniref:Uncharacterized protein n=1 Tax=Leptidea sinapis TaxID=189913 RepID=A0A5E4Q5B0_9NEOP|nr:unnamed protein product [Leptidea sinapis]